MQSKWSELSTRDDGPMTPARPPAIVSAWLICVAVLAGLLVLVVTTGSTKTPFEREAIEVLTELEDAPPGAVRIVVLGNSIIRRATADAPSLDTSLQALGYNVEVANISGASRWSDSYERMNDDIFAAEPDIVIMQVEMFGSPLRGSETDLRSLVRRRLGLGHSTRTHFRNRCIAGPELALQAPVIPERLRLPAPGVSWGASFIAEANEQGVQIYLLGVPRSDELAALAQGPLELFHSEVVQQLGAANNVAVAPRVTGGGSEFFCDHVHMNELGQARFLEQILPDFAALIDQVSAS